MTTTRRITSAVIAAAAVMGLAFGMAGTADADPGSQSVQTSRFKVFNNTNKSIFFINNGSGPAAHPDSVVAGPKPKQEVKPGGSVWFDVRYDATGGHSPEPTFSDVSDLKKAERFWFVTMYATSQGDFAECSSNFYTCTPGKSTKTNQVSLLLK
jgi:hypothetical protein